MIRLLDGYPFPPTSRDRPLLRIWNICSGGPAFESTIAIRTLYVHQTTRTLNRDIATESDRWRTPRSGSAADSNCVSAVTAG